MTSQINGNVQHFSFKKEEFDANIGPVDFIQDNESKSSFGVLRGLHYQKGEHSQAKLVRVLKEKCSTLPLICVNHRLRLESMFVYCLVKKIRDNFLFPVVLLMARSAILRLFLSVYSSLLIVINKTMQK